MIREQRQTTQGKWGTDYGLNLTYDDNGNITRIEDQAQGGKDISMDFDALNRLAKYYEDTTPEKGTFSYNCQGLLKGKEVNGDITKLEYDPYNVLKAIIKPAGDMLEFNFDLLGRLRKYWTSARDINLNHEGSKRLGDYDNSDDEWKRYHWCKTQLLGYADDTNTYYIVPDVTNSTKLILDSSSVVNRLDYDHLGYLRNKTTDPQVELLWSQGFKESEDMYLLGRVIYKPKFGLGFKIKPSILEYRASIAGLLLNSGLIEGDEQFGSCWRPPDEERRPFGSFEFLYHNENGYSVWYQDHGTYWTIFHCQPGSDGPDMWEFLAGNCDSGFPPSNTG